MQTPIQAWTRSPFTDAGQIVTLLDKRGGPGAAAGLSPAAWYEQLIAANETSEALSFLAQALPRYECIVWVAQALLEIGAVDREERLMVAILRWIDSPDDSLRRVVMAEADRETEDTPAKLLGLAVAFSGGSMVPPEYPPVTVPPETCGKMAAGALMVGIYALPNPGEAIRKSLAIGEKIVAPQ
jgi:hypothetical protein